MYKNSDKLDEAIARYRRLQQQINDRQVQEAAAQLVAELEAKKAALHLQLFRCNW